MAIGKMSSEQSTVEDFKQIAREIEGKIVGGLLKPGERLLPQREFAWQRKIAVSTASRVYAELRRKRLIVGEVGRGTYVRAPTDRIAHKVAAHFVDLDQNFPSVPGQSELLARSLASVCTPASLSQSLGPPRAPFLSRAQSVAASFLQRESWSPISGNLLFASNGREALAVAFATVARRGDRIGVETITYVCVKDIAAWAGIELVPLAMDHEGLLPDAIRQAHRERGLAAVYLQPSLHNPLGVTMSEERRAKIASVLEEEGLFAIEDAVNSFLADGIPLAAYAPAKVIHVESLSKRVAPSLTAGLIVVPPELTEHARHVARIASWSASGWMLSAAVKLMEDGSAARLAAMKREDATKRQAIARAILQDFQIVGDGRAYHLWLELPRPWRAEAFAAAAAERGIVVTPGGSFAVGPGHAPGALRLTLGTPAVDELERALRDLVALAHLSPEDAIAVAS